MKKDDTQKAQRLHLFLYPHQVEYLNRFAEVRNTDRSKVVRDMIEDYVHGKFFRDSSIAPNCVSCNSRKTISSNLCSVCAIDLIREHNAEDGEADRRAENLAEKEKHGE